VGPECVHCWGHGDYPRLQDNLKMCDQSHSEWGSRHIERQIFLICSLFDPIKLELYEDALHHYCPRPVHVDRGCFNFLNVKHSLSPFVLSLLSLFPPSSCSLSLSNHTNHI
jgi:hypothetical protein